MTRAPGGVSMCLVVGWISDRTIVSYGDVFVNRVYLRYHLGNDGEFGISRLLYWDTDLHRLTQIRELAAMCW